jgi:hypothetical protein
MDDDFPSRQASLSDEQREAARKYDEERRARLEKSAREFLRTDPYFLDRLADHKVEDERTKELAIGAAARAIAEERTRAELDKRELGRLIEGALDKAFKQAQREREEALKNPERSDQQAERTAQNGRHSASTDPRRQWLGKYADLKGFQPPRGGGGNSAAPDPKPDGPGPTPRSPSTYAKPQERSGREDRTDDDIARRQREESDKRQTLTRATRSNERKPTEQEHTEARTEQTERKLTAYERARRGLSSAAQRQTDRPESRPADRSGGRGGSRGR